FPSPHAIQATWLPAFAMTGLAPVSRHYPSLGTLKLKMRPQGKKRCRRWYICLPLSLEVQSHWHDYGKSD
ncbi:MAG: hypothetical protein L6Q53_15165, partial [Candidatus Brocadia sinica]|nr:hypothetical protein [Candidatus Brocadia sinica]